MPLANVERMFWKYRYGLLPIYDSLKNTTPFQEVFKFPFLKFY